MQAGSGFWIVGRCQVFVASLIEGLEALVIIADGVSSQEKDEALRIARERRIPALCLNCEEAVLCRITPNSTSSRSLPTEAAPSQRDLDWCR